MNKLLIRNCDKIWNSSKQQTSTTEIMIYKTLFIWLDMTTDEKDKIFKKSEIRDRSSVIW